jgi:hypothetical protein
VSADSQSHLARLHGGVWPWLPPRAPPVCPRLQPRWPVRDRARPAAATELVERLVNTVRFLAVDTVEKANSGPPRGVRTCGPRPLRQVPPLQPRELRLVQLLPLRACRRQRLHAPLRTAPPCRVPRCHGELQISYDLICRLCI